MDPLLKTVLSRSYQAPANPALVREVMMDIARYARALEAAIPTDVFDKPASAPVSCASSPSPDTNGAAASTPNETTQSEEPDAEEPDEDSTVALSNTLKRSLVLTGSRDRFFGASSSVALVDTTALELKRNSVLESCVSQKPAAQMMKQHMRPEFWTVHPWEQATPTERKPFEFPPPDLLNHLVQLYFDTTNIYIPLLHRPTFEKALKADHHLSNPDFGQVVLGVCAVAARYSNDERVLLEGTTSLHSSGYKWFRQLRLFQECFLRAPSLGELQALCLAVVYMQGTSTSDKCWYLVGIGARAVQDIGLNKKGSGTKPTVEGELRKRVFWVLLFLDSLLAASVGRPAAMNISDFDVEMPLDCDDEYWEHPNPELAFKQPPGVPSKSSYFRLMLKLVEIHASSHRAFFSVRRPDPPPGVSGIDWNRITLANLDSALNSWADSVPQHLRWEPDRLDGTFLNQSAKLWTTYYATQILAHRAFVTCPYQKSLALTSLAICTSAARACIRIMAVQSRKGQVLAPHAQTSVFTAGLMLLLNFWRARHTGVALADEIRDMDAIFTSIKVLQTYESRWHSAGRFCDILMALVSMGMLPMEPTYRAKRRRSAEDDGSELEDSDSQQYCSPGPQNDGPSTHTNVNVNVNMNVNASPQTNPPASASPSLSPPTTNKSVTTPDLPLDTFVFDTPDLAGSFSQQLHGAQKGHGAIWNEQLEQLQSLYGTAGFGAEPIAGQTNLGVGVGVPTSSSAFFGQLAGAPPQVSANSWPTAQALSTALEQNTDSLLSSQDAALWTGVPSGYDMNDWGRYLSNVQAFSENQPNFDFNFQ
ncbi:hypothetical protein MD484_g4431, partial [Candolleomyces efflorescens]